MSGAHMSVRTFSIHMLLMEQNVQTFIQRCLLGHVMLVQYSELVIMDPPSQSAVWIAGSPLNFRAPCIAHLQPRSDIVRLVVRSAALEIILDLFFRIPAF